MGKPTLPALTAEQMLRQGCPTCVHGGGFMKQDGDVARVWECPICQDICVIHGPAALEGMIRHLMTALADQPDFQIVATPMRTPLDLVSMGFWRASLADLPSFGHPAATHCFICDKLVPDSSTLKIITEVSTGSGGFTELMSDHNTHYEATKRKVSFTACVKHSKNLTLLRSAISSHRGISTQILHQVRVVA